MTEDTTTPASDATEDERAAKALERIADCLEALVYGDETLRVWIEHISDAGESDTGKSLGYIKVVARDEP